MSTGVRSPIRVGVQLPGSERPVAWSEYLAIVGAAEELGFDSVRLGDHLLYRQDGRPERGPLEAWTLLAAIAAATSRIRIGPLVACTSFHHPGLIAKMAATVDAISGGRLILGLGAGWNEPEYHAFGLPFDRRADRFAESVAVISRLLAGERVSLRGEFYTVRDAVLAPPPIGPIPLLVGSSGDRMLAAGLPHADWWNLWYSDYGNTVDGYAKEHARISSAAERVGRPSEAVARSVGVLVEHEPGSADRTPPGQDRPVRLADLPAHCAALAEAGADEAVIIMHTMNEQTLRRVGAILAV